MMKNIYMTAICSFLGLYLFAQTPGINYQAVLRDGTQLVTEKTVFMRITLMDGAPEGAILYQEDHTLLTDALGYINLMIGEGQAQQGELANLMGIPDVFVKIEVDVDNQGTLLDFGTSKLGVSHYALYGEDEDADPDNELQSLSLEGNMLMLSQGDSVDLTDFASPWKTENEGISYSLNFGPSSGPRKSNHGDITLTKGIEEDNENLRFIYNIGEGQQQSEERGITEYDDLPDRVKQSLDSLRTKKPNRIPDLNDCEFNTKVRTQDKKNIETVYIKTMGDSVVTIRAISNRVELDLKINDKMVLRGIVAFLSDDFITILFPIEEDPEDENRLSEESFFQRSDGVSMGKSTLWVFDERQPFNKNVMGFGPSTLDRFSSEIQLHSNLGDLSYAIKGVNAEQEVFNFSFSEGGLLLAEIPDITRSVLDVNSLQFNRGDDTNVNLGGFDLGNGATVGAMDLNYIIPGVVDSLGTTQTVGLGNLGEFPVGVVRVSGFGIPVVDITTNQDGAGSIIAAAPGGLNWITTTGSRPYILQTDPQNIPRNFMVIQEDGLGCIGSNKFTTIEPMANTQEVIAYPSLTGPESAIYDRGTAQLVNGEVFVSCPDHFQHLADPGSMTISLTPLSAESKGLAVIEKTTGGFKVKELYQGTGNYQFDYLVMCQRKSGRDHQVIQQKADYAPAKEFEQKELGHHMNTKKR